MKKNLFPTLILSGLLLTSAVCAAPAPRTIPIPAGTAILGAASAPAEIVVMGSPVNRDSSVRRPVARQAESLQR